MDIEIVTTKKKLTKLIVSQFKKCSNSDFILGEHLGLLRNCRKDLPLCLLIKDKKGNYSVASAEMWASKNEDNFVYVNLKTHFKFKGKEERDEWIKIYNSIISNAKQIFI